MFAAGFLPVCSRRLCDGRTGTPAGAWIANLAGLLAVLGLSTFPGLVLVDYFSAAVEHVAGLEAAVTTQDAVDEHGRIAQDQAARRCGSPGNKDQSAVGQRYTNVIISTASNFCRIRSCPACKTTARNARQAALAVR